MRKTLNLTSYMKPFNQLFRYSWHVVEGMTLCRDGKDTFLLIYTLDKEGISFYRPAVISGLEYVKTETVSFEMQTHVFRVLDEDLAKFYLWTSKDGHTPNRVDLIELNAMNDIATLYEISRSESEVWKSAIDVIEDEMEVYS